MCSDIKFCDSWETLSRLKWHRMKTGIRLLRFYDRVSKYRSYVHSSFSEFVKLISPIISDMVLDSSLVN